MMSLLLALLMALFGIAPAIDAVPVDPVPHAGEIRVEVGATKRIEIGSTNQSARRRPMVVEEPDATVLSYAVETGEAPAGCAPGGCEQPTYLDLTGRSPGTTEFVVTACFEETADECTPMGDPVTYLVTVS